MNKVYYFEVESNEKTDDQEFLTELGNTVLMYNGMFVFSSETIMNKDAFFAFWPEGGFTQLIGILRDHDIQYIYSDVTETILLGKTDERMSKTFEDAENRRLLYQFIIANSTADMVLDKIISRGLASLTDTDKWILKNAG